MSSDRASDPTEPLVEGRRDAEMGDIKNGPHSFLSETPVNGNPALTKPRASPSPPRRVNRVRLVPPGGTKVYTSPADRHEGAYFVGLAVVALAALASRLWTISEPDHVAWDETHFGKHASWYIQGKFFFDVHPPLGKLIIAVAGVLSGYNGSFEFKEPGQKYDDTPYVGMRVVCALMGLLVAPLAYVTVWEVSKSTTAAFLAGVIVICETGTLVLSQYILLDPPLLFFIMASTFCCSKFINCREEPYDLEWWYWLTLTGMFLGCAFSVKWVGLFVIVLVGMTTVKDLWDLLGDLNLSMREVTKHFLARALCLILFPVVIYMSIFYFHFIVLSYSGNGDGFFSSAFQSTLVGNELHDQKVPEFVAYGSVITLKNHRGGGGLLHSHSHLYPEDMGEFQQQQVTAYTHKDDNNKWLVKKTGQSGAEKANSATLPWEKVVEKEKNTELVHHGDIIVLEHISTQRNLHGHAQTAPMTKTHFQVTGYGENGVGDTNDEWQVELEGGAEGEAVRTVASLLRLRHKNLGCYLHSHGTQLPKWGWEQLEVTCNPRASDRNNLWNVEGNVNDALPMVSFEFYKPSFFSKFLESHLVMAESNNNMKPKEGEVTSKPWQWPLNFQGQLFSGADHRVYLLGNPIIFWGCGALMILFLFIVVFKVLLDQRKIAVNEEFSALVNQLTSGGLWLLLGWSLHYLPFYLMGRVLYFHHYFPALMFCCMLGGIMCEFCVKAFTIILPRTVKGIFYHSAITLILSVVIGSFVVFMPLAYGMKGPKADSPESSMYGLKWLATWDI